MTEQTQTVEASPQFISLLKREVPKALQTLFLKAQEKLGVQFVLIDYAQTGKREKIGRELLESQNTVLVVIPDASEMASDSTHKILLEDGGPEIRLKKCCDYYHAYPDREHLIFGEYSGYNCLEELYGYIVMHYAQDIIIFNYDFLADMGICDAKLMVSQSLKRYARYMTRVPTTYRGRIERMVDNFLEFNKHIIHRRKRGLRDQITNKHEEERNHYRALQRIEREISELNTLARSNMNRTNVILKTPKNKLVETFQNFFSGEKCHNIQYFNDRIEVDTNEIYINYGNVRFYMGRFRIVISFEGWVKMFNLDDNRIYDGRIHHPHIEEGVPCLGNIKEMMPKLIHSGDYLTVINICYEFLVAYNRSGPYVPIERGWLPEGVEWCERCQRAREDGICDCSMCDECGRPEAECTCERCPRDGVRMTECCCEDCSEWNPDDGCCDY